MPDTNSSGSGGTRERAAELYALGLPTALILKETGLSGAAFRWAMEKAHVVRPGPAARAALMRELRIARIKANILASPSVSMFEWKEQAA